MLRKSRPSRPDGSNDEQKAYPTRLGVAGPLVYYTDPTCTGRPVQDTFCVAWPEVEDKVWWKPDFQKYDPEKFQGLLRRTVEYLNNKRVRLYVKDVYCRSNRAVIIDMKNRIALVVGRADYCGVVKKTMFTVMNFMLPNMQHLSMHCSATWARAGTETSCSACPARARPRCPRIRIASSSAMTSTPGPLSGSPTWRMAATPS